MTWLRAALALALFALAARDLPPLRHVLWGWLYFAGFQVIALACLAVGAVLLLPWAAMGLWHLAPSPYWPGRLVTAWNARWLQAVWGNWEDGVTGVGTSRGVYLPGAPDWWRAYMWSAWRNSTNNLRFLFTWKGSEGAPFIRVTVRGWYAQAGWFADNGFPVFSAGAL